MSQYHLKFVAVDRAETRQMSEARGSAVRSHAIRAGLQQGASHLQSQGAHQSQETIRHKQQLKGRFRLSRATTPAATAFMSIQEPGADNIDPFDSLPVVRNPRVESLLRYFLTAFNLNMATVDPRSAWFPYAMQSSATMHATLALAAAFWSAKMPTLPDAIQREGLRQKGEAMRQVGQLARRDFAHGSVGYRLLLATIANLSNVEAFYGDFRAVDVHLKAAYQLFQSGGGTKMVQDDYVLCKCLNWVDIQSAVGLGRVPLFPSFHSVDEDSLPTSVKTSVFEPPLNDLLYVGHNGAAGFDPPPHQVFVTLRQALAAQASATVSPHTIRVLVNNGDRSISQYLYGASSREVEDSPVQKRTTALMLAAQIFLYIALRQVPPTTTSPLLRILCRRLQKALEDTTDHGKAWEDHYSALLWVAFVGILGTGAAAEKEETERYSSLFNSAAREEGLADNKRLQDTLSSFLWEESVCAPVLRDIMSPNPEDSGMCTVMTSPTTQSDG